MPEHKALCEAIFGPVHGRSRAIDELRGLAILAVLASHIGLVFGSDLASAKFFRVPALGVGVDLFFVISGFAIAESVKRSRESAHGAFWRGAVAFWIRRVLRIGLPTWAVIIVVAIAQMGSVSLGATTADLKAAIGFYANFHWAPCFAGEAGCGAPAALSHFWSLACEMQFYLAAPFLVALSAKLTALFCVSVLAVGALSDRPWGGFWWTFRLDGFAVGILLSLGMTRRWPLPRFSTGLATFWLVAASILAPVFGVLASGAAITLVALIFGLVVASALQQLPRARPTSTLQRTGELSFSLYLIHLPIMSGIHGVFGDFAPAILVLGVAASVTLILALLLEYVVTRPAQNVGKRFSEWCSNQTATNVRERVAGKSP